MYSVVYIGLGKKNTNTCVSTLIIMDGNNTNTQASTCIVLARRIHLVIAVAGKVGRRTRRWDRLVARTCFCTSFEWLLHDEDCGGRDEMMMIMMIQTNCGDNDYNGDDLLPGVE